MYHEIITCAVHTPIPYVPRVKVENSCEQATSRNRVFTKIAPILKSNPELYTFFSVTDFETLYFFFRTTDFKNNKKYKNKTPIRDTL